jgi:hypothetical protein
MDTTARPLSSIGIDIGKEVFHVVGFGTDGKIAFHRKIKRLALVETFRRLPPSVVGMEACLSATLSAGRCVNWVTSRGSSQGGSRARHTGACRLLDSVKETDASHHCRVPATARDDRFDDCEESSPGGRSRAAICPSKLRPPGRMELSRFEVDTPLRCN